MRLQNWPERLGSYIISRMTTPFAWGAHDCVTFANGAHEAVMGVPVALPTWGAQEQADALLGTLGGLASAVDTVLTRLPVAYAQRGDLVLIAAAGREWLAVCDGEHAWAPAGERLTRTPMDRATVAWSVGHG